MNTPVKRKIKLQKIDTNVQLRVVEENDYTNALPTIVVSTVSTGMEKSEENELHVVNAISGSSATIPVPNTLLFSDVVYAHNEEAIPDDVDPYYVDPDTLERTSLFLNCTLNRVEYNDPYCCFRSRDPELYKKKMAEYDTQAALVALRSRLELVREAFVLMEKRDLVRYKLERIENHPYKRKNSFIEKHMFESYVERESLNDEAFYTVHTVYKLKTAIKNTKEKIAELLSGR